MSSSPPGWRATFTNVPPLTKSVSTSVTVMTALGLALRFRDMALANREGDSGEYHPSSEDSLVSLLAMVPVSAPYRFWTFATAAFFERSILQYAINIIILLGSGKYLERAWGSREFFKFLAVTSVGTMVCLYLTCLFEYIVRGNDELLYGTQAHGLTCVLAGFLIGFKQLVPEHLVTLWGIISVRVKTLPLAYVIYMAIEALISQSQIHFLMAIYGLFISWIYSRFVKVQDGVRGDRSETFSFASFFPEAVQPPVRTISNVVFGILVSLRICSPLGFGVSFQNDLENPQMTGISLPSSQPASLRAEAERRRALALKALDMRLHAAAGNSASLPNLGRQTFLGPSPSAGTPLQLSTISVESPLTSTPKATEANENTDVLFETNVLDEEETDTAAANRDNKQNMTQ